MFNTKFCTKCGSKEVDPSTLYCTRCGEPLKKEPAAKPTNQWTDEAIDAATSFINQANSGLTGWGRWIAGIVLIIVVWQVIGNIPLLITCGYLEESQMRQFSCSNYIITGDSPILNFVLTNYGFIIGIIGIWVTLKFIRRKTLTQVITGRQSFDYNRTLYAILVGICIFTALFLFQLVVSQSSFSFQSPRPWEYLLFFMFAIVLVPYQCAFEEIFFRGYLMQGISLITRNKYLIVGLSSLIFMIPHLLNPEPYEYGFFGYILTLLVLGAAFGLITLLDGGIELAVGMHAINNLWLYLIASTETSVIDGLALFEVPMEYGFVPFALFIFYQLIYIAVLNRKYKWFEWRKLVGV